MDSQKRTKQNTAMGEGGPKRCKKEVVRLPKKHILVFFNTNGGNQVAFLVHKGPQLKHTRQATISHHFNSRHQNFGPIFQPKFWLQNQSPSAEITGGRELSGC